MRSNDGTYVRVHYWLNSSNDTSISTSVFWKRCGVSEKRGDERRSDSRTSYGDREPDSDDIVLDEGLGDGVSWIFDAELVL